MKASGAVTTWPLRAVQRNRACLVLSSTDESTTGTECIECVYYKDKLFLSW